MWGNAELFNGGLDMGMPGVGLDGYSGDFWGDNLIPNLENGTVPDSRVDDAVRAFTFALDRLSVFLCPGLRLVRLTIGSTHNLGHDLPFFPTNDTY